MGIESACNAGDKKGWGGGWFQSLDQEDPLVEEMVTHSSVFARFARGLRVGHD